MLLSVWFITMIHQRSAFEWHAASTVGYDGRMYRRFEFFCGNWSVTEFPRMAHATPSLLAESPIIPMAHQSMSTHSTATTLQTKPIIRAGLFALKCLLLHLWRGVPSFILNALRQTLLYRLLSTAAIQSIASRWCGYVGQWHFILSFGWLSCIFKYYYCRWVFSFFLFILYNR